MVFELLETFRDIPLVLVAANDFGKVGVSASCARYHMMSALFHGTYRTYGPSELIINFLRQCGHLIGGDFLGDFVGGVPDSLFQSAQAVERVGGVLWFAVSEYLVVLLRYTDSPVRSFGDLVVNWGVGFALLRVSMLWPSAEEMEWTVMGEGGIPAARCAAI